MSHYALTIGGKAVTTAKTFDVLNPADETVVAACPEGTPALVDEAVSSARRALPSWAALPDSERVSKLLAIADVIEKHHAELSELVTREQGKTQSGPGANLEVGGAAAWTLRHGGPVYRGGDDPGRQERQDRLAPQARRCGCVDYSVELAAHDCGVARHACHTGRLHRRHQAFTIHTALDVASGAAHEPNPAAGGHQFSDGRRRSRQPPSRTTRVSTRSCSRDRSPPAKR